MPPIAFIVTKYDLCEDHTNNDELREVISEAFLPLFGNKDTYVAIIPVSLGANIKDNDYHGALKPKNVHLPILFGIEFALLGRIDSLEKKIQRLISRISAINADIGRKQKNIEDYRWDKTKEEDKWFIFRSSDRIRNLSAKIENTQDSISSLKSDVNSMQNELEESRRKVAADKSSLSKVEGKLKKIPMIFANGVWQEREE